MDDKIQQWYVHLIDVYGISKATFLLAEKLYDDYDDKSNMREMQIVLINALFHSAAVNIGRILDNDENGINVHKFLATYCTEEKTKITFMVDLAAVERLRKRRNKILVHADKGLLSQDVYERFPLYISDLKSILKSLEDLLLPLGKKITGNSVAGINQKTGEWDFEPTRQVETQYTIFKDMLAKCRRIERYMGEKYPYEFLRICYDKGENENGQT